MAKESYEKSSNEGESFGPDWRAKKVHKTLREDHKKETENYPEKGMSSDEIYEKLNSFEDTDEKINYVDEMRKNIEEQHPGLVTEGTKNSLDKIRNKLKYIKEGDENLKQKDYAGASVSYYDKAGEKEKLKEVADKAFEDGDYASATISYKNLGDKEGYTKATKTWADKLIETDEPSSMRGAFSFYEELGDKKGLKKAGDKFYEEAQKNPSLFLDAAHAYEKAGVTKNDDPDTLNNLAEAYETLGIIGGDKGKPKQKYKKDAQKLRKKAKELSEKYEK